MEASGTSGQKASVNGVVNFSVLDGWWAEGYNQKNGWTIGTNAEYPSYEEQDIADSQSMYYTLENKIIPAYYAKDENGNLLPDEIRLTRFGQFLRSTSIDELPELLNILNGDMSIVGPRPLLVQYLERYNEEQKHRHDVKPGLTGLAQVNGRNGITWEEKFHYDLEYVKNITFYGDCKIIFQTVMKVFGREGISSATSVTMEEFKGNK